MLFFFLFTQNQASYPSEIFAMHTNTDTLSVGMDTISLLALLQGTDKKDIIVYFQPPDKYWMLSVLLFCLLKTFVLVIETYELVVVAVMASLRQQIRHKFQSIIQVV